MADPTLAHAEVYVAEEAPDLRERLVIAPCRGRFSPLPPEICTTEGEWVEPGQVLAEIVSGDTRTRVVSSFRGWLMGMLCLSGEPVHEDQALFWIYVC